MDTCVYICIPVYNRLEYTLKCIESIRNQTFQSFRIVICDDGSTDGTFEIISEKFPEVIIVKGTGSLWWAGATNMAVSEAIRTGKASDFVYTLNNDTELLADTLENAVSLASANPGSIIGSVNVFFEDPSKIEPSAFKRTNRLLFRKMPVRIHTLGDPVPQGKEFIDVDAFAGKGVLIPFAAFEKAGLYNSEMLPHYHADTEFTLRAQQYGFRLLYSYRSKVLSHQYLTGSGTMNKSLKEFIRSFKNIKSAIHYQSVVNFSKLAYGNSYRPYLFWQLARIVLGYIRRFFRKSYNTNKN